MRRMISRQWILAVLSELPLWYWPVFFWEVAQLRAWWATNPIAPGAMIVLAVTRHGRIVTRRYYPPARPDPVDWTRHAPRAPWAKLAPGAALEALVAPLCTTGLWCTENVPLVYPRCTASTPFLDSG